MPAKVSPDDNIELSSASAGIEDKHKPEPGLFRRIISGQADLELDSPAKAITILAIPSMAIFFLNTLLELVGAIFVSWLGELPMTAMSFVGPVNLCFFALLESVGGGAASLMGRHLGRHEPERAAHIARSALALLYFFCILFLPMIHPSVSNVVFSAIGAGGDKELLRLCWLYNLWFPIMMPFIGFTYIANTVFRAQGNTIMPFKAVALANLINLILVPIFIFVFGWGISGAAIATWFSRIASTYYLFRRIPELSAIPLSPLLQPRINLTAWWKNILWIGLPVALSTASIALGMGSVNKILIEYGTKTVSAWMLSMRVEGMAFNTVIGLGVALVPYVAYNYGRRDLNRMMKGFNSACILGLFIMCSIGAVIYIWPDALMSLFRPSKEISGLAIQAIRASVPSYPFSVFLILACSFFVGIGQSFYGTLSQIMRSIVFRITAAWFFVRILPLEQVWWFQSLAALLGSFVGAFFFIRLYKKLKISIGVKPN